LTESAEGRDQQSDRDERDPNPHEVHSGSHAAAGQADGISLQPTVASETLLDAERPARPDVAGLR
jgi:hypothetical protein